MHRTPPPSSQTGAIVPPPVVAPPVVQSANTHRVAPERRSRFIGVATPVFVGAVCSVAGLLVGQAGWMSRSAKPLAPETPTVDFEALTVDFVAPTVDLHEVAQAEPDVAKSTEAAGVSFDVPSTPVAAIAVTESSTEVAIVANVPEDEASMTRPVRAAVSEVTEAFSQYVAQQWSAAGRNPNSSSPTVDPRVVLVGEVDEEPAQCASGTCDEDDNRLGTLVHWADKPADAYREASKQGKLVFLIHVSGNFKIPGFT